MKNILYIIAILLSSTCLGQMVADTIIQVVDTPVYRVYVGFTSDSVIHWFSIVPVKKHWQMEDTGSFYTNRWYDSKTELLMYGYDSVLKLNQ